MTRTFCLISAGGFRDFSHEGRRRGSETGPSGNTPFLVGIRERKSCSIKRESSRGLPYNYMAILSLILYMNIHTHTYKQWPAIFFFLPYIYYIFFFFLQSFVSLKVSYTYMKIHTLALDSSWHGLMLRSYLPLSITIHVLTHTLSFFFHLFFHYIIYIYIHI